MSETKQTGLFEEHDKKNRRVKTLLKTAKRVEDTHLCKRDTKTGVGLKLGSPVLSEGLTMEDAEMLRQKFQDFKAEMATLLRGTAKEVMKSMEEDIECHYQIK